MDQFFKELREIQKKERGNSSLARVGSDFYKRTYNYIDKLKANIGNDPFSNEHYLLKDIQRIATEICERREHKITDTAVMNIHRSYHLFKGKPKFDLLDTTPLNLTNEEEKLYFSLIDTLKNHRESISLDKLTEGFEDDSTKIKSELNNDFKNKSQDLDLSKKNIANEIIKTPHETDNNLSNDKVLNRLNEIKKAKVIKDENYENVKKQLNKFPKKSQPIKSKSTDLKNKLDNKVKSPKSNFNKVKLEKTIENADLDNIFKDENEQFVELNKENFDHVSDFDESISLSKDGKIVNETILIFSKVPAIVGVDEKIYGPFYPQDIVVMPNVNANIIIKNKKGRLIKT
ncbi:MAG: hypothetical protein LBU74_00920 [Methanobacteriaceae archaeon]|nr:hypothetical protein [Candidatus Methanorudis spinitermitis]